MVAMCNFCRMLRLKWDFILMMHMHLFDLVSVCAIQYVTWLHSADHTAYCFDCYCCFREVFVEQAACRDKCY